MLRSLFYSILGMLLFVLFQQGLSSCSNNDEFGNEKNQIVGTWKDDRPGWIWTYTFHKDGTCKCTYKSKVEKNKWLNSSTDGIWSYGANILSIKNDNNLNNHTWIVTQISNSNMTVVEDGESTILTKDAH